MWYLADNKVKMRSHPKTMREPQRILFERIASFEKLRLQHSNLGRPTLFACMADVAVERQCSDPRDYVYAVLGLAKDTFGIMPRYDLSLDDVIRDASLRALAVSPFSVLEWGGLTRGNSNTFPSFVPTLSRLQNPVRPLGESGHYESATHEKSSIELLGRELLSVAGAEIDTIVWIDDKDVLEHIQEEFNTTIESDIVAHFVRQVATDTYHRPDDDDFDKDLAQRCGLSVDHLKLASAFIRVTYLGLFESSKHICAHLCGNGLDPRAWNNPELQGRAYFRTKKGFIGLTARNAVLGDEVVLFSGGEVPFILRKHLTGISHSAERWKLIGDCFLDGWMYWHEGHWLYEPIIPESFQDGERSIVRRKFVLC